MKHARLIFAGLLLFATSTVLGGCYTQLATDKGDYYGYHHRRQADPVRSDTFIVQQRSSAAITQPLITQPLYDTIMKGDTMFIEEHGRPAATDQYSSGETDVNNYYDGYGYSSYDYGWFPRPRSVFSISIGYPYGYWPVHSWYSPWYSYQRDYGYPYDWGYGYPGYYPPIYDAYYSPYYGYGGYRHHSPYYSGYLGGYGGSGIQTNPRHVGRTPGGERRPGENIGAPTGHPNIITSAGGGIRPGTVVRQSEPQGMVSTADRNAPVHAVAPGTGGPVTYIPSPGTETRPANVVGGTRGVGNALGNSTGRPVTVVSGPATATSGGRRVVVVRRSGAGVSGGPQSGYGRSNSSGGTRTGRSYGTGRSGGPSSGTTTRSSGSSNTPSSGGSRPAPETRSNTETKSTSDTKSSGETRTSGGETRPSGGETRGGGGGGRSR